MSNLKWIATILFTVTISVLINIFVIYKKFDNKNEIYSIDLGKIIASQKYLVGRMISNGIDKPRWMSTIKDASQDIKKTIKEIAGNHLVTVGPAIVQGSQDITDQVLTKLGLPTNLPMSDIQQSDVMPAILPKTQIKPEIKTSVSPSESKPWLLP